MQFARSFGWTTFLCVVLLGGVRDRVAVAQAPTQAPINSAAQITEQQLQVTDAGTTEIGRLRGVSYRIDVPKGWKNAGLLVYYHGYSAEEIKYSVSEKLGPLQAEAFRRGFAVLQSQFSVTGWALEHAVVETEALRKYFTAKFGEANENIVSGHSMGGALTLKTIEQSPKIYSAALAMCGPLVPTYDFMQMRVAQLAAFEYYFPGILPKVSAIPKDYRQTPELLAKLRAAIEANPKAEAAMTALSQVRGADDLARKAAYAAYVVRDFQQKAGGQPFDNRNLVYVGTEDDAALNRGVERYAGDPMAAQYLMQFFTPTGNLLRPLMEVHTLYDRLIPASTDEWYSNQVMRRGHEDNFVLQYVEENGHCNFTPKEEVTAFDELLSWLHDGKRPASGLMP
ncbi:MAG: alpha/beta fold hydrolase [Terracidiphilus sp.]|nr:alpha/beta fold hydrolase [Terracidiphilus sp.]MDR3796978.1 alpha/beta fold hydrolase [Terracidiphilus sp.]